jgi:D-alanine-D-alanine ligase-like ATP-grasp enzyme
MCLSLARTLGLPLAGIDLISPDPDSWYCLEVNPSPAFGYFERHSKLGIAEALAFRLAEPALGTSATSGPTRTLRVP